MDRLTTFIRADNDHANLTAFPSNLDANMLFVAINDPTLGDDDQTSTSSMLLDKEQVAQLINDLVKQYAYLAHREMHVKEVVDTLMR